MKFQKNIYISWKYVIFKSDHVIDGQSIYNHVQKHKRYMEEMYLRKKTKVTYQRQM